MAIRANKTVCLPDGRLLGYDECGAGEGVPVLVFPDVLSSRVGLAGSDQDAVAARLGVRLLAVDRPGIGASNPRADRTVLDWPVDVLAFADALNISRFGVLGVGAASAYVGACALRIPHRVWAAGIVAGTAPPDLMTPSLWPRAIRAVGGGRRFPFLLRRSIRRLAARLASNPNQHAEEVVRAAAPADRTILADPLTRQVLIEAGREVFRLGIEGPLLDLQLVSRDWGFRPAEIQMVVNLWFGEQDGEVPPAATRLLADAFRRSETRSYPEGHWSLMTGRLADILESLMATARREDGRPVA